MSFGPIAFLANVERIFAANSGLTAVKSWTRPTKLTTAVDTPEVYIEYVAGSVDSVSLSKPHKRTDFYIRFTIYEEQTTSTSQMDAIYQGILAAVAANPDLKDSNGAATCDYFGTFYGKNISFDLVATEKNGISVNAMKIDVPCMVRDI
jgi:hypothetical protein